MVVQDTCVCGVGPVAIRADQPPIERSHAVPRQTCHALPESGFPIADPHAPDPLTHGPHTRWRLVPRTADSKERSHSRASSGRQHASCGAPAQAATWPPPLQKEERRGRPTAAPHRAANGHGSWPRSRATASGMWSAGGGWASARRPRPPRPGIAADCRQGIYQEPSHPRT